MKLSFVVPCYNSVETIQVVVDEIESTMRAQKQEAYEIILVNDCSPDDTLEVIRRICEQRELVKAISLARNFGQHAALMAGFKFAKGEMIVALDDDGQTPVNELDKLLVAIEAGNDVVLGKYAEKKHSFFRNLGSHINDWMAKMILGKEKGLYLSSFFVVRRYVIDKMLEYKNPFPYIPGLLLRTTKKIVNVDVTHRERIAGASNYSMKRLFSLWINGFTAFSVKPLRIATFIGSCFSILGFIYAMYIIIRKLFVPETPMGYSSTMAGLLVIGGVQMIMLGAIGEYVGRIYISINESPQYVIREEIKLMNGGEAAVKESEANQ